MAWVPSCGAGEAGRVAAAAKEGSRLTRVVDKMGVWIRVGRAMRFGAGECRVVVVLLECGCWLRW